MEVILSSLFISWTWFLNGNRKGWTVLALTTNDDRGICQGLFITPMSHGDRRGEHFSMGAIAMKNR